MSKMTHYALITGGSSGIGYQYARVLAQKKYNIIIVSNDDELNHKACQQIKHEFAVDAISFFSDLTLPDSAEQLFQFCIKNQLDVEILVLNAGMFFFREIPQTSPELAQKMLMLHVNTPSLLCVMFSNYMREKQSGHILITASISAWMAFPGISFYGASKRYIKNFARSLRYEMKAYHVNVSVVCPGAIDTDLYNLTPSLRKLARRLGIMISPERLAKKAIQAMFQKRFIRIPGVFSKLSVLFSVATPPFVIFWIKNYLWKKLYPNQ